MNKISSPLGIQIIGTQRSGSNLLRVILDQSDEIASPHPPHILVTFVPLLNLYGPLNDERYRELVSDVVDYVNANPVPWDGVELDKDWIYENSKEQSLFEINRLVYESVARAKNAKYWCCKSMANVHYASELEKYSPKLKYIYLYRDGRDVALSFKKAIVGEKHIYHLAQQWFKDQAACIELSKQIEPARFFALNYEELIANPEEVIKKLCGFLEIEYFESMLDFHCSKESLATANAGEMWENLAKPIIKDNTRKFLKELSAEEINIFELINQQTLTTLGYTLVNPSVQGQLIPEADIVLFNSENAQMKQRFIENSRQSDLDKRNPQLEILKRIKNSKIVLDAK